MSLEEATVTTRPPELTTAVDPVERMFTREAPNRLWLTDITEHRTYEGTVYCAVGLDTSSRRVVGCPSTPARPPHWSPPP